MFDVVAIGELLIDFTCQSIDQDGYPTMVAHPGGAPANYLAALSQHGFHTALIGKVGNDAFGKMLIHTLQEAEVDTAGVKMADSVFTTMAFVTIDSTGNRTFSFARKPGADTCLSTAEIDFRMIENTRVFHFGTLSLTDEPSRSATRYAVAYAKTHNKMVSFDPNLRKSLWNDLSDAKSQIEWGLDQADVVKISDEEVDFLWNLEPTEGANKILQSFGAKLVFVTCGSDGCVYANQNGVGHVACPPVKVVDTTGAGDIFGGSAMAGLLKSSQTPENLSAEDLRKLTLIACTTASLSTQNPGGIGSVPNLHQVQTVAKLLNDSY